MVDVYRSSDFEELEAARNGEPDSASQVVTKDVQPEQVETAPAQVIGEGVPAPEVPQA